jgi:NAD(P)-dependent dehydrogenase (short-subunit alcohol dehydrogenase family)
VTSYESQKSLFASALSLSPTHTLNTVVANAGVRDLSEFYIISSVGAGAAAQIPPPDEPDLTVISVNLNGVLFTTKLALHYLSAASTDAAFDRQLVLIGSMASFASTSPPMTLYSASKHAVLGLFRSLRLLPGIPVRINMICPYFADTPILSAGAKMLLAGMDLASVEDVAEAVERLVAEPQANGRCLAITPRTVGGIVEIPMPNVEELDTFGRRVVSMLNARANARAAWSSVPGYILYIAPIVALSVLICLIAVIL